MLRILYYDDKPLFEDIKVYHGPWQSNIWRGFIVLDTDIEGFDKPDGPYGYSFRLVNRIDSWLGEVTNERDEYAKKLKAGWDVFIKYLHDAGKIVE